MFFDGTKNGVNKKSIGESTASLQLWHKMRYIYLINLYL